MARAFLQHSYGVANTAGCMFGISAPLKKGDEERIEDGNRGPVS